MHTKLHKDLLLKSDGKSGQFSSVRRMMREGDGFEMRGVQLNKPPKPWTEGQAGRLVAP